jgi:hypothetical protein
MRGEHPPVATDLEPNPYKSVHKHRVQILIRVEFSLKKVTISLKNFHIAQKTQKNGFLFKS